MNQSFIKICIWQPNSFLERSFGASGLQEILPGTGILFSQCRWIHTFTMKFDLDCLGLNSDGRIVRIECNIPPGKLIRFGKETRSILELCSGEVSRLGINLHTQLRFANMARMELKKTSASQL